jgi:hypothetical protein
MGSRYVAAEHTIFLEYDSVDELDCLMYEEPSEKQSLAERTVTINVCEIIEAGG